MAEDDWFGELAEIRQDATAAAEAIVQVIRRLGPGRAQETDTLADALTKVQDIERRSKAALSRYLDEPTRRLLAGSRLNREQFYLLVAAGLTDELMEPVGVNPMSEFELFTLLYYEDGRRGGYINPQKRPVRTEITVERPRGKDKIIAIGKRFIVDEVPGIAPEEISARLLRPEQHRFFRTHLPETYRRFARDDSDNKPEG